MSGSGTLNPIEQGKPAIVDSTGARCHRPDLLFPARSQGPMIRALAATGHGKLFGKPRLIQRTAMLVAGHSRCRERISSAIGEVKLELSQGHHGSRPQPTATSGHRKKRRKGYGWSSRASSSRTRVPAKPAERRCDEQRQFQHDRGGSTAASSTSSVVPRSPTPAAAAASKNATAPTVTQWQRQCKWQRKRERERTWP